MSQVIIYQQDNGNAAIVRPTDDALALIGIDAIAAKDVPAGRPYAILLAADIPTDRALRDAWTVDVLDLIDGEGAAYGVGSDMDVVAYAGGLPVLRLAPGGVTDLIATEADIDGELTPVWTDAAGNIVGIQA